MEQNMENEMETGIIECIGGYIRVINAAPLDVRFQVGPRSQQLLQALQWHHRSYWA